MRSPPALQMILDAEAQAEQAHREGQAIVRDHLSSHLQNNTGRSSDYISWIATLHPENADITIDERFLIPGNPWWTIYETWKKDEFPTATAVPVEEPEEQDEETPSPSFSRVNHKNEKPKHPQPQPHCLLRCSPLDYFMGIIITSQAIWACVICEILAFAFYLVAVLFWWIGQIFNPPNAFTGLFYSLFMIIYYSFALADSIVLLTSVLVTEVLAGTEWIVSLLFGGIWMANNWHQFIRRSCHCIRSVLRAPWNKPTRHFVMCGILKDQEGEEFPELVAPYAPAAGDDGPYSNSYATADAERIHQVAQQDIVFVEGSYKDKN